MAVISTVTPLKQFRLLLHPVLSQESMAHRAGVVLQTYRKAEKGRDVLLSTAMAIWKAVNSERQLRGHNPVSFEQLFEKVS
jgi:DNA-binding XRE family transcriptional regulator